MRKHFGMYQNGISASFISDTADVLFIAGDAMRLPCLRVLLFSHRSFSSSVSCTILPSSSRYGNGSGCSVKAFAMHVSSL